MRLDLTDFLNEQQAEVRKAEKRLPYTIISIGQGPEALKAYKVSRELELQALQVIQDIRDKRHRDHAIKMVEDQIHFLAPDKESEYLDTKKPNKFDKLVSLLRAARKRVLREST